jgi:predicted lipase
MATASSVEEDSYAYVGLNVAEKLIVVSFRGTCDYDNIMTDTNFIKTRPYPDWPSLEVHRGFYNSYSSISTTIIKGVMDSLLLCPMCRIAIIGHSLGGAVATLAAFDLSVIANPKHLYVFTYGSPRVGNQYFAQIYGERVKSTWRFVHAADPIPHLPGTDVNFWHVSTEMWIRNDTYIKQCNSVGEDPTCADSLYFWDYDYGLSDHRHYLGEYTKDACSC